LIGDKGHPQGSERDHDYQPDQDRDRRIPGSTTGEEGTEHGEEPGRSAQRMANKKVMPRRYSGGIMLIRFAPLNTSSITRNGTVASRPILAAHPKSAVLITQ
jgi:hypothetical protein